jgi:hypothetical protein
MGANGISKLGSGTPAQIKEARQIAKLEIAQSKRQGKVVAVDGTITGVLDDTKNYYRYWNVYDRLTLAGPYNIDEALTTNPLADHRPWTGNAAGAPIPLASPTVNTNTEASTQPVITGTYDTSSTTFTVTIDSVTYTLGTSPELTTDGSRNWTLDLTGSTQTLSNGTTYDIIATSDGTTSDTTTNEITTVSAIEAIVSDAATSLEIWYDGSDITQFQPTNPSDGDGITQWNDKSNFAHNANPISTGPAARATYEVAELNTYSVVRFDGDAGLSINPFASLANSTTQTVFVVAKGTNLGTGTQYLTSTNNGGLAMFHDGTEWKVSTSGGTGASGVAGDANWHILGLVYDGNGVGDANKLKLRIDKVEQTLDFSADPGVGSTLLGTTNQYNFACREDGVSYFVGDIAEVLMFNKILSAGELADVEEYLNTHWAIGL